jgi:hypothetical protein
VGLHRTDVVMAGVLMRLGPTLSTTNMTGAAKTAAGRSTPGRRGWSCGGALRRGPSTSCRLRSWPSWTIGSVGELVFAKIRLDCWFRLVSRAFFP